MIRRLLLFLPLLAIGSCSSSGDDNPLTPGFDSRGTAVAALNALTPERSLVWSAATDEIVGVAGSAAGFTAQALVAVGASSGTLRLLDSDFAYRPQLSSDGGSVYYEAFAAGTGGGNDHVDLRRRPLGVGSTQVLASCAGSCAHIFAITPNESRYAWSRIDLNFDPESLRIVTLPGGALESPGAGLPVAFAPDGNSLLYQNSGVASDLSLWTSAGGPSVPYSLGLPIGASAVSVNWSDLGAQAVFQQGAHELWLRNATAGTTRRVLLAAVDSLLAAPIAWSRDGRQFAVWTLERLEQQQQTVARLYVVDLVGTRTQVVASGLNAPGAIAFSPDGTHIAQMFGGQLYTSETPAAALAARAERLASDLRTATHLGGKSDR